MSLKKLLLLVTLCSLLSGCNVTNLLRMRYANDHLIAEWPTNQTQVKLRSTYVGEKPYVYASINGIDGFKFMIDTGASMTYLLDTTKVKALNLSQGYTLSIGGWGDEEDTPIFQTEVDKLTLSGVNFTGVNLAYIPVSKSKYFLRPDEATFDGVLGHDILHHFSWSFDKRANRINISSQAYQANGSEISIEFDTFLSKISIEGRMNFGDSQIVPQELIIDTGSRHYLKVNAAFVINNEINLPGRSITAVDFGLSGRTIHQRVTIPELKLGTLKIANIKANLIGNKDDDEDENWVIGSALINQFISIIDYHSGNLHLITYSDAPFRTRYNLLGLELRKIQSGDFVVRYVFPDMASAKFDIKEGDTISSINAQPSTSISQGQWLDITSTEDQHQICRKRNKEKCFTITSREIPGYSAN